MSKASIIYLTYNQLEYATKPCLDSLYKFTNIEDFELIIVDNNSSDGTQDYLQTLQKQYSNIKLILNTENHGYAQGNNIGLEQATGEYIILLNNDTLLTQNWLDTLINILDKNQNIGLIGPVSNNVANEQRVEIPNITEHNYLEKSQEYIKKFDTNNITYTNRLIFFCVAMRKEILKDVGYLDGEYKMGGYEDDDYCIRALNKGYQCAYTDSCFVYHKGSATIKSIKSKTMRNALKHNHRRFNTKHNKQWTTSDIVVAYIEKFHQEIHSLPECPQKYSLLYRINALLEILKDIKKKELRLLKQQNILYKIKKFFFLAK